MTVSDLLLLLLKLLDEKQIIITMVRSWLLKILLCFSHTNHGRRKQQQNPTPYFIVRNLEKRQTVQLDSSIGHIFSPPLKVCMLRRIRCRIQSRTPDNNLVTSPISIVSSRGQPVTCLLNESQNCAETLPYEYTSSIARCKQYPSLIAIDIGNNEFSQEQTSMDKSKFKKTIRLYQ
jgi:hypothetical protein